MPKCGRRADKPAFESNIGGILRQDYVNRNAPFGTTFTPLMRNKIIGGKFYTVQEISRPIKEDKSEEKLAKNYSEKIELPEDKASRPEKYMPFNSQTVLPPISSTLSKAQEIKVAAAADHNNESPASSSSLFPTKPVDGYSYLPVKPITLSKEEEAMFLKKLSQDLTECTAQHIKLVYEDMATNDRQLQGWIDYSTFIQALHRHKIYPNMGTLRLLASTCISKTDPNLINYEQLLSLVLSSVKLGEFSGSHKLLENTSEEQSFKVISPRGPAASSEAHMLRSVQNQVMQAVHPINIERLRSEFVMADRSHRLTLSHSEIKDICYRSKVPLDGSVINEILAHCQTHGDGQFVWTDFIGILEKVIPEATGLPIPVSKRPLEFAKRFPQPNESWPHPEPPKNQKILLSSNQAEPEKSLHAAIRPAPGVSHHHVSAPPVLSKESTHYTAPKQERISPDVRQSHETSNDPWFDGFRKMAEGLYKHDLNKKGYLRPDVCKWFLSEYNNIYDLEIPEEKLEQSINKNTTRFGTDIDGLLRSLIVHTQA